jgi:hypothetical protein
VSGNAGRRAEPSACTTVLEQSFDGDSLYALRSAVAAHAPAAGLPRQRVYDVVTAAPERAANAVRHGAGHGQLPVRHHGHRHLHHQLPRLDQLELVPLLSLSLASARIAAGTTRRSRSGGFTTGIPARAPGSGGAQVAVADPLEGWPPG